MGCESNRMPEQEMNFIFDYDVKVYTVSKTVDSVEGALWLATQTPNILCKLHFQATRAGFEPENIAIIRGINDLKSPFYAL